MITEWCCLWQELFPGSSGRVARGGRRQALQRMLCGRMLVGFVSHCAPVQPLRGYNTDTSAVLHVLVQVYPGAAWLPCGSSDNPTTVTANTSGSTPLVTAASAKSSPVTILMPMLSGGQAPAATAATGTTGTRPGTIMEGLLQAVLGALFGGRR